MTLDLTSYRSRTLAGFTRNYKDGVVYFTVPSIERTGYYRHGFMSRIGGMSSGCFSSLNLSMKRENDRGNVLKNFAIAAQTLEIDEHTLVLCHYAHGNKVEFADGRHFGMGITRENLLPECDGVAVKEPGVTAVTIHADCNPIFFADKKGRAAGVCHAGWRGTYSNIVESIASRMSEAGVKTEDLLLAVGPSIGPCCFEVHEDVYQLFSERYGKQVLEQRGGKLFVDLPGVLLMQMEALEIPPENVTLSGLCTYCNADLFYSHRRDKGQTGAMGSFMQII